jgi:hypothetical protein
VTTKAAAAKRATAAADGDREVIFKRKFLAG